MVDQLAHHQHEFFRQGDSRDLSWRIEQLKQLKQLIRSNEEDIMAAINEDLGRSQLATFMSEIYPVLKELKLLIKKLSDWAKPQKVKTPLLLKPGTSHVYFEPFGSVLILTPWNYPFQLLMSPVIGALSAGNCVVAKPSEISANTANLMANLINDSFSSDYLTIVEGGIEQSQKLLAQNFDLIFFTGSKKVGKEVMKKAAGNLTPVILELGGKSPCIVAEDGDLKKAAARITWGKFFNAGQTCIAPDYLLAERSIREKLIGHIRYYIDQFYGENPVENSDYSRIINTKHFDRLIELINNKQSINSERDKLFIPPTVIEKVTWEDPLMQEEIFGPLLPVIEYSDFNSILNRLSQLPKPLATYLFSSDKNKIERLRETVASGSLTVNDLLIQAVSNHLPFGGVGESGMGRYRGRNSFEAFSNKKAVLQRGLFPDWKFRYPPYKIAFNKIRRFFDFF